MTASGLLPPEVVRAVNGGLGSYGGSRLEQAVDAAGVGRLAIKYGDARYAATIRRTRKLHISTTLGFTWGTGVYCTPLDNALSTAIFGRVGAVARFAPSEWTIFDATDAYNQDAYIRWLQFQPLYTLLTLTVHAALANQLMRNRFREMFEIDCVLFHPDQADTVGWSGLRAQYTAPDDTWMCVSDFGDDGRLQRGLSSSLDDAWPCVVIEEQFEPLLEGMVYEPQIGPLGRTPTGPMAAAIAAAHAGRDWHRVPA